MQNTKNSHIGGNWSKAPTLGSNVAPCYGQQNPRGETVQCNPQNIKRTRRKMRSWRKAALKLNTAYGVRLSHLAWRDYAVGRRDIADPTTRIKLGLGPRTCSICGSKPHTHLTRLLQRLEIKDLRAWRKLREQKKYKAAKNLLDIVYNKKRRTDK